MTSSTLHGLISKPLELEHRDIDACILGVADGTSSPEQLRQSLALLRRHIYMEEVILFPRLSNYSLSLTMPVSMMEIEHGYMWPIILRLEAATHSTEALTSLQPDCNALMELLTLHNQREENILYAAADRLYREDPGAGAQLLHDVTHVDMPAKWSCELYLPEQVP